MTGRTDPGRPRRPEVLIFDVNETLSDMSVLAARFAAVGAPRLLAQSWFADVLRDGFALAVAGTAEPFAGLAAELLRARLGDHDLDRDLDRAVEHVWQGFAELEVHPDVVEGVTALAGLGIRLVTLSNGSTQVAQTLLDRAGVRPLFEQLLSVEQAGVWKPANRAYAYALSACGVDAQDAMLVAVHPWDTDGAARAGLRAAWVNRAGGAYPTYFTEPELSLSSLTELARTLT